MTADSDTRVRTRWPLAAMLVVLTGAVPSLAQVPIVQPGAPGEPARELTAEKAIATWSVMQAISDPFFR